MISIGIATSAETARSPSIQMVLDGKWVSSKGRGKKRRTVERFWIHPSLNEWATKTHFQAQGRLKEAWTTKIANVAQAMGLQPVSGPVVVSVATFIPVDRNEDIDNRVPKFILDGLVAAGLIEDDGRRIVVDLRMRIEVDREWPRTEITIERAGVARGLEVQ